ncbi:MAG: polyphosphate kinase 2 family protein [Lachnospiraceae bacterium]|nr:polyphosphate kinase 2 family protein [Lachnospiraceae bacterium]
MKDYLYDGSGKFVPGKFNTAETGGLTKEEAVKLMNQNLPQIDDLQKKLYAEKKEGIIFLFQAMDAAGKDGTIQAVLSCLSPHGVKEYAFKAPNSTELAHDYLWRIHQCIPERGQIAIFNRSHYEDVIIGKVHKLYEYQTWANYIRKNEIIKNRYEDIRNFEKYLYNNSVRIVKIYLNVSKEEQAKRFLARLSDPKKYWKFSGADLKEREYWDQYQKAFTDAINKTATEYCPWYVVPADHKWYMRYVVSEIILNTLKDINPKFPKVSDSMKAHFDEAREVLEREMEK